MSDLAEVKAALQPFAEQADRHLPYGTARFSKAQCRAAAKALSALSRIEAGGLGAGAVWCGSCKGTGFKHKWQGPDLNPVFPPEPCPACKDKRISALSRIEAGGVEGTNTVTGIDQYARERLAHQATMRIRATAGDSEYWRIRAIISEELVKHGVAAPPNTPEPPASQPEKEGKGWRLFSPYWPQW